MHTWVLAGALTLGAPALKEERKPVKAPDGEWTLERDETGGLAHDHSRSPNKPIATFSPTRWKMTLFGRSAEPPYQAAWFDGGGQLKADFWTPEAKGERAPMKAIWKVEGDTLTICLGWWGEPRPTDFAAPKKANRTLLVFKRKSE